MAPHPDDEVFGVGGIMRELVRRGRRLRVIAVTDGEAAYGPLPPEGRSQLIDARALERSAALDALEISSSIEVIRLGVPDGQVAANEPELTAMLDDLAGPTIFATWRHDGHPDHEAVGRAAAEVARRRALRLVEYVVWAPHRDRMGWRDRRRTHRVELDAAARAAKIRAVAAFTSQTAPSLDGRPVVPAALIDGLAGGIELVFT